MDRGDDTETQEGDMFKNYFLLRRVAQIVGEHYCTVDIWNLSGTSIGYQKESSMFLPSLNIRHTAQRFPSTFCSGALPK